MKIKKYTLLPFENYESVNRVLLAKKFFRHGLKKLCYIAVNHTFEPNNEIFELITKTIDEIKPDLILLEGGTKINFKNSKQLAYFNKILNQTKEEVICTVGEFGYTLQIALQKKIEVFCPEPEELDQIKFLLSVFKIQEIFVCIILEQAVQLFEQGYEINQPQFNDLIEKEINWLNDNILNILKLPSFTFKDFETEFERITNKEFTKCVSDYIIELNDPIPWKDKKYKWTIINQISQEKCIFRDRFILNSIQEKLNIYSNILIIYGGDHFYSQQPSLNKIFNYKS